MKPEDDSKSDPVLDPVAIARLNRKSSNPRMYWSQDQKMTFLYVKVVLIIVVVVIVSLF